MGDDVVTYYANRVFEGKVLKIGKKYITTNHNYCNKFDFEGYGNIGGYVLFPGNINEYNDHIETQKMAMSILRILTDNIHYLSKEDLNIIQNVINKNNL